MLFWILVAAATWAVGGLLFVVAFNLLGLRFHLQTDEWAPDADGIDRLAPRGGWSRSRRADPADPAQD